MRQDVYVPMQATHVVLGAFSPHRQTQTLAFLFIFSRARSSFTL